MTKQLKKKHLNIFNIDVYHKFRHKSGPRDSLSVRFLHLATQSNDYLFLFTTRPSPIAFLAFANVLLATRLAASRP